MSQVRLLSPLQDRTTRTDEHHPPTETRTAVSESAGTATAARGDDARGPKKKEARPGPVARISTYVRQVVAELRKVIWPTRKELVTYTSVVLVFVAVMVTIVAIFDFAFTKAVLAVFGK
jgi:preprotein translocase subunit SecE